MGIFDTGPTARPFGPQPRQGGQLKGTIWVADNFDVFDEELEKMFYGEDE